MTQETAWVSDEEMSEKAPEETVKGMTLDLRVAS